MTRRTALELLLASPGAFAQQPAAPISPPDYVCPMDPDVRAPQPGFCKRCGMKLLLAIPDFDEYPLDLTVTPRAIRAAEKVQFVFRIRDPKSAKPVAAFEIVHERLFHLFIVSQDLSFFVHTHPQLDADGVFRLETRLPKAGLYRVLCDFYPAGGTPQLIARTIIVDGAGALTIAPPNLVADLGPSRCANLGIELVTDPVQPISGMKTLLFFKLNPSDGLEKYLGAWGHMLVASDDLVDMIHSHPFIASGNAQEQFNLIFPRARTYRLWLQVQRSGVVNTAIFTLPVSELK